MGGFLDAYGVAEERRARLLRRIKRFGLLGLAVVVAALVAYFGLRTRSQERVMAQFLDDLRNKNYPDAYKLWCNQDTPCKYYPLESFQEDWGASSRYANASAIDIQHVDYCDTGVVFTMAYPNADPIGLWVERSTGVISFAPWPRCPGRHLQLGAFFKSLFS